MPVVWFEVPAYGPPRFDLHVAHGNAELHGHTPFAPDAMDGHGELLNWYASEPRACGRVPRREGLPADRRGLYIAFMRYSDLKRLDCYHIIE